MPPPPEPPLEPLAAESAPPQPPASEASSPEAERLATLRERLLNDARELVRTYERELDALQEAFGITTPTLFEGVVTLKVGGVQRTQDLLMLEEALRTGEGVDDASVRHYDRGEAWLEISLDHPVALAEELARLLPFNFAIRSETSNEIVLDLEQAGG
jgi:hypothetical protein